MLMVDANGWIKDAESKKIKTEHQARLIAFLVLFHFFKKVNTANVAATLQRSHTWR
jgi:hypothetical protein